MSRANTIAIDFDGVIHAYSNGWEDGTIYDPSVPGALDSIKTFMDAGYSVFILSSREPEQIVEWMGARVEYSVEIIPDDVKFWTKQGSLGVTNRKLPAFVYIDDRAYPFTNWTRTVRDILEVI